MQSIRNVLLVSLLISVLTWIGDSALDAWVFHEGSFWGMLIQTVPAHEAFTRSLAVAAVFAVCMMLGWHLRRQRRSQEHILHLNRVLRAIRNVNQLIAREGARDSLLQKACDCLTETRGYWTAWIALLDDNRRFIHMAASNLQEKKPKLQEYLQAGQLPYCCQQALLSTHAVSYNLHDDCGDCPIRPSEQQLGMAMQLSYGKKVFGVLVVTAPSGMVADPQERELMEEIASDLGFALHDIEMQQQAVLAAKQLEESSDWLSTTLSSIGDGVVAVNRHAEISFMNPVASALTGWGRDAIGRPLAEVFQIVNAHTRRPAPNPVDRVLAEGNIVGLANHTVLISRDGKEYQIADSAAPIRSGGGPVHGVVLVFRDVTEQYLQDQALAESERRYHSLFDALQEGFALHEIICDAAGRPCDYRFLEVNPAFERLTSLQAADILGKTVRQILPSVEQSWIDTYGRVALTGEPARFQNFSQALNRHYDVIAFSPNRGQFATLFVDVTEVRHVEAERETMIKLLRLLNSPAQTPELLRQTLALLREWSTCEAVGIRLRDGNDFPYYETSGFSAEFVAAETKLCTDDTGQNPSLDCMCGTVLAGRTDPSQPFFTATGSFWTNSTTELLARTTPEGRQGRTRNRCHGEGFESVALIPLRVGHATLGLLQFNDKRKNVFTAARIGQLERLAANLAMAMAQRRAQDALADSERTLATMFANLPGVVYRCKNDPQWSMLLISDAIRELAGYDAADFISPGVHTYASLIHPEDRDMVYDAIHQSLQRREPYVLEYRIVHKDGRIRWVYEKGQGIWGEDGLSCLEGVIFDISERKHLEDQLRQSQKLEAIGRLAGGVAHDFRNQLTVIKGYCDLLMPSLPRDNALYEPMDQIRKAAERSAAITNQLLIFSRKQPLHAKPLDLDALLRESQGLLATMIGEDIRLVIDAHEGGMTVLADKSALQQALMNLVANARDAMPTGGQLRIEAARVERSDPGDPAAKRRPCIMLSVSDTGMGMDAETLNRIFDPFFTTKDVGKGTGLGLATVYGFIQQSGGQIEVESRPGEGSTFRLYFPLCTGPGQRSPSVAGEAATFPGGTETIMVVEDEIAVQKLIIQLLNRWGYTVLSPASGPQALEMARKHAGAIDLLLTDIVMPEINGVKLAEQVRTLRPQVKVLYISGYADVLGARQIGLPDQKNLLVKPFAPDALARKLREALDDKADKHTQTE